MKNYDNHFVSAMYAVNEDRNKRRKRRKYNNKYKKYLDKAVELNYMGYTKKDEDLVVVGRREIILTINDTKVVKEVRKWGYVPIEKPWVKKVWYSGTRKYARKCTNNKLRNCKELGKNPGAYRKVFDYWDAMS